MLSAMFSHEPPKGVYKGMMPCVNSQRTDSGVLCPAKLSSTNNIRNGGRLSASVSFTVNPCCQRSQEASSDPGSAGVCAGGAWPG